MKWRYFANQGLCRSRPRPASWSQARVRSCPQDTAGKNTQRGSQHAVDPRDSLGWAGTAQDVVLDDLALAQEPLLVIEESGRLDHLRSQNLLVLPGGAGGELLQGKPTLDRKANQRPFHRGPVPEGPIAVDLGRIIAKFHKLFSHFNNSVTNCCLSRVEVKIAKLKPVGK